jgi:hypothetical protein
MYIRDGDAAGATNVYRLYQTQSLPAKSTFIHNTKLVINTTDTLNLIEASNNGATFDVVVSYLEQT